ncbi:bifunctional nuclease family protein [Azoarcus taiwanensis]|uniref:BFN domain-containing protein n=1 Tax=Azoarcus taiwanensis TaxID=666964 RepID=A0A972FG26_9RHOO|nr:bifunctional nuclease family protein [Azoarcus taiwanensis]NMG04697.1 hypothetical protein [Azoarcus taiwanensis]
MSRRLLMPLMLALTLAGPGAARELAVTPESLITVELATVAMLSGSNVPVVLLREPLSGDVVPIFIGPPEARAILMALHGVVTPRPMTHDLLQDVIDKLSGKLVSVVVDDLRDGTYHGALEVNVGDDARLVRIDARPSDALALAARSGAEIRVAPKVLQAGIGMEFEGLRNDQVVSAIGITVVEATDELRDALGLPDTPGVLVTNATGRAAYAGIGAGALVLSVNGSVPTTPMEYLEYVRATPSGEHARVDYWHDGERREASLPTAVPERRGGRPVAL